MKRTLLVLFVLFVFSANAVAAGDTGYCNTKDPAGTSASKHSSVARLQRLTFTVTPLCKDVSYVAFGFPSTTQIVSPSNGSEYAGTAHRIPIRVSVPAGGQVLGNAIKFQPPSGTWNGTAEKFVVTLRGLGANDPIQVYLHAGGGAQPIDLSPKSNCGPSAVTMQTFTAAQYATSGLQIVSAAAVMAALGAAGMFMMLRRRLLVPPSPHPRIGRKVMQPTHTKLTQKPSWAPAIMSEARPVSRCAPSSPDDRPDLLNLTDQAD